jgi:succinoglycan biosynthesis protein ExoV
VKLYHWTRVPNFGDQLNQWLWHQLLPDFFDDDVETLFFGIGTLLNGEAPAAKRAVIFGTGVGYGTPISKPPESWQIYCVRGPLSAMALNIPLSQVATDPAILIRRLFKPLGAKRYPVAFMPHWRNASAERIAKCRQIEIQYIDPLGGVESAERN